MIFKYYFKEYLKIILFRFHCLDKYSVMYQFKSKGNDFYVSLHLWSLLWSNVIWNAVLKPIQTAHLDKANY